MSLKPEKGGLFCERIFGPVNDYECSCRKKPQYRQKFCPDCEVEYTTAKVRRYRLGYIQLTIPITHIWYLKGRPSYLSIVFDFSRKKTESIVYCTQFFSVIFSEFNFSHHLIKLIHNTNIKINKRINFYSLIMKRIKNKLNYQNISSFIKDRTEVLSSNLTINLKLTQKLYSKRIIKQVKRLRLGDPRSIMKIRFNAYNEKYNSFNQNYFCLNQLFTFDDLNTCFYFNLYIHSFIFISDFENYLYSMNEFDLMQDEQTGSFPLYNLLSELEFAKPDEYYNSLLKLERQLRIILIDFQNNFLSLDILDRLKLIQRLKIIRYFRQKSNRPSWMILLNLPVLPPDLRPILQLSNDQIAISDLNKLYQKVIFRNKRLQKLLKDDYGQTLDEIQYAHRLLQESVDSLIENGKNGKSPIETNNDRPLKSLSDILKGKKGRFRQNLLGKRVDYSGRSVIVVGPNLQLNQCGIPIEMAIELFRPFIIKYLLSHKFAKTMIGAKQLFYRNQSNLLPIIKTIIQNYPVLLNRAPTLHRLSVQAFQPILVTGKAILLHPLVCSAFNADFDGDQMAVHIPLSFQARAEAWKLLWSVNNFISPATGQPILSPSQDMVLGCYFLTLKKNQFDKNLVFNSYFEDPPFKPIWILWNDILECDQQYQKLIELRLDYAGKYIKIYPTIKKCFNSSNCYYSQYIFTTVGRLIFHNILNYYK